MTRTLTGFSLLLALAAPLLAEVELEGTPRELSNYLSDIPETVAITGSAEKKVPADRAVLHLKVTTESKSMDDALAHNRVIREQITKKLLIAGLTEERIKAAQFSSTPESGLFGDKIKNYKVENTMKARAVNEAEFRAIASLVDSYKEVRYEKTEFELSNRKEVERLILAEACQDAGAKKAVYETGLYVDLTPIRFHEGRVVLDQPVAAFRAPMKKTASFSLMEADSVAPPAQFDEMHFRASVTVEYRLKAK